MGRLVLSARMLCELVGALSCSVPCGSIMAQDVSKVGML